jgi:hypothetical protein
MESSLAPVLSPMQDELAAGYARSVSLFICDSRVKGDYSETLDAYNATYTALLPAPVPLRDLVFSMLMKTPPSTGAVQAKKGGLWTIRST